MLEVREPAKNEGATQADVMHHCRSRKGGPGPVGRARTRGRAVPKVPWHKKKKGNNSEEEDEGLIRETLSHTRAQHGAHPLRELHYARGTECLSSPTRAWGVVGPVSHQHQHIRDKQGLRRCRLSELAVTRIRAERQVTGGKNMRKPRRRVRGVPGRDEGVRRSAAHTHTPFPQARSSSNTLPHAFLPLRPLLPPAVPGECVAL